MEWIYRADGGSRTGEVDGVLPIQSQHDPSSTEIVGNSHRERPFVVALACRTSSSVGASDRLPSSVCSGEDFLSGFGREAGVGRALFAGCGRSLDQGKVRAILKWKREQTPRVSSTVQARSWQRSRWICAPRMILQQLHCMHNCLIRVKPRPTGRIRAGFGAGKSFENRSCQKVFGRGEAVGLPGLSTSYPTYTYTTRFVIQMNTIASQLKSRQTLRRKRKMGPLSDLEFEESLLFLKRSTP